MSTLKVGTIQDTNGANPSTAEQMSKGRAKAWVNFDGKFNTSPFTTANGGIRSAFNVSSVTDNGAGDYTVAFSSAMPDANYAVALSHKSDTDNTTGSGARPMIRRGPANNYSTTSVRIINSNVSSGVGVDPMIFNVIIFGD
tara:strand:- start:198 stop:620 length:423 start_codon:yes stop_codon:yes gene_type:complete